MTPDELKEARALAERLKNFASGCRGSMWQSRDETVTLMGDGADSLAAALDEIERLREAVGKLRSICLNRQPDKISDGVKIADDALKGQSDV